MGLPLPPRSEPLVAPTHMPRFAAGIVVAGIGIIVAPPVVQGYPLPNPAGNNIGEALASSSAEASSSASALASSSASAWIGEAPTLKAPPGYFVKAPPMMLARNDEVLPPPYSPRS
jgi:hypothetical protein